MLLAALQRVAGGGEGGVWGQTLASNILLNTWLQPIPRGMLQMSLHQGV